VNFGPQMAKMGPFFNPVKINFLDAHISEVKGRCSLKNFTFLKYDQRLLKHTSLGMGLSPAIFNAQNSTFGKKYGVLWIISSGSVGGIAPNFSA